MDLHWDKLDSRYILREKWATLRVDTCRMPNGRIIPDYYVLEYPEWVNAVALTTSGEVILLKQYRHAAGKVFLELPGGCVEEGESAETACRRELLEETGYQFEDLKLISTLYGNPATANNKTYCFLATGGRKVAEQALDEGEDIRVELYSKTSAKNLLFENEIGQALHASGLFFGLKELGEL